MKKPWFRVMAIVAVLAIVAAACANDDADETTTTTTAAPSDTTTTTEAPEETTTTTEAPEETTTTTTEAPDEMTIGTGVTEEPCPGGDADRGCIYLGVLTDESGPFAGAAPGLFAGQQAFWAFVNSQGGIGGEFDVALPDNLKRDTQYNPEVFVQEYNGIAEEVAAIAQSLGTPQTIAALPDYDRDDTVAAPMSWWSGWQFDSVDNGLVVEFGLPYCFESMNAFDWSMQALPAAGRAAPATVGILFFPTDYGLDYAVGVREAAEAHGVEVAWETPVVPISAGGDPTQVEAVQQVIGNPVDVVYLVTGPSETGAIVGGSAAQGFQGVFIGAAPSWNVGLLASAAAPAFEAGIYFQSSFVGGWDYDSQGHENMRTVLEGMGVTPNDFFISGWVSQYGLKAVLDAALAAGDLSHDGIRSAAQSLESVGYDGMMPERSFVGDPQDITPRTGVIGAVDTSASTGIAVVQDFFVGPTAEAYDFSEPCSQ